MAVICMTKKVFNGTEEAEIEMFSVQEKGLLYSIIAIGSLISSLTVMKVIDLCGGSCPFLHRLTVIMYTLVAGIATICLPMCAQIGFIPVLLARLFQGIGAGIGFAFIGYMASAWSPIKSYGIFMCALTSYGQLGPLIMMSTVGYSCGTKFGWEGVYYVSGVVTLIICILFYYIYTDTPRQHKYAIFF
uniref:Major facilitator superfamily (MFS) profile domain-containing protein n=1 Tax=Panagrolaimus sp. PS1159 TaxID=55785 RepID=A0AC35FUU1_9BILA